MHWTNIPECTISYISAHLCTFMLYGTGSGVLWDLLNGSIHMNTYTFLIEIKQNTTKSTYGISEWFLLESQHQKAKEKAISGHSRITQNIRGHVNHHKGVGSGYRQSIFSQWLDQFYDGNSNHSWWKSFATRLTHDDTFIYIGIEFWYYLETFPVFIHL